MHKHNPFCMAVSTGLRACREEEGKVNVYVCLADVLIPAQSLYGPQNALGSSAQGDGASHTSVAG